MMEQEVQTYTAQWNHPNITSRAPQSHKVLLEFAHLSHNKQSRVRTWMRRMWFPDNPSIYFIIFFFNWGLTQFVCLSAANHHISHRVLPATAHPALPWWSRWLVRALAVPVNTHLKWQCHKCGVFEWPALPVWLFFFFFLYTFTVCTFIPSEEWQRFRQFMHNLSDQNWTLNFTLAWCSRALKSQP